MELSVQSAAATRQAEKRCTKCKQVKPLSEFARHLGAKNYLRPNCRACSLADHRQRYRTVGGRARILFNSAKANSKRLDKDFTLTLDWVRERIARGTCEVTGLPFVLDAAVYVRSPWAPSLDRENPQLGYTPENVRVVVLVFNIARNNWGDEPLRTLLAALPKN